MYNEYADDSNKFFENLQQKRKECINELSDFFGDKIVSFIDYPIPLSSILDLETIKKATDITSEYGEIKFKIINIIKLNQIDISIDFGMFNELYQMDLDFDQKAKELLGDKYSDKSILVMSTMLKIAFCRYIQNNQEELLAKHHIILQNLEQRIEKIEKQQVNSSNNIDKMRVYYDYYNREYERVPTKEKITGKYSLKESYYPAYDKNHKQIIDRIEEWINVDEGQVMLLHGEPGHGKTSFCYNVMYQFIHKTKLTKMKNVFYFNLNPKSWDNLTSTILDVFRCKELDMFFKLEECRNSLVLLDGYDELKSELDQNFKLKTLIYELKKYARANQISFVITSRTTAIVDDIKELEMKDDLKDSFDNEVNEQDEDLTIIEFAHLRKSDQNKWVKKFDRQGSKKYQNEWKRLQTTDLYNKFFYNAENSNSYNKDDPSLLGIPILFRIIILNPIGDESIIRNRAGFYFELLKNTLERDQNRLEKKDKLIKKYEELAYRIYANRERKDTITDLTNEDNEILFTYYLKGNKFEIGFIHRSFYQFFLARYFYRMIKSISLKQDSTNIANDYLASLLYKKLDNDELVFLKEMYENDNNKNELKHKYEIIMDELVKTQGIISSHALEIQHLSPNLNDCNNVFVNCINIMSSLNLKIMLQQDRYKSLIDLFRNYNVTDLNLSYQKFERVNFSKMNLSNVDFSNSICFFCKFNHSDLRNAKFTNADLTGSRMQNSNLKYTDFKESIINFVDFRDTIMDDSNIMEKINSKIKGYGYHIIVNTPIYQFKSFNVFNYGIKIGTYYYSDENGRIHSEEILGRALDYDKKKKILTVITEKIIDNQSWSSKKVRWEKSDIRKYLNGEGKGKNRIKGFVDQIQYNKDFHLIESTHMIKDKNGAYYSITDNMYLLSIDELKKYFIDEEDRETRDATSKEYDSTSINTYTSFNKYIYSYLKSYWWLSSLDVKNGVYYITDEGKISSYEIPSVQLGVRPIFKIQIHE